MKRGKVKPFWEWEEVVGMVEKIRLTPDDDLPRLVLADWLEERGDTTSREHGAFIRWHVANPKAPPALHLMSNKLSGRITHGLTQSVGWGKSFKGMLGFAPKSALDKYTMFLDRGFLSRIEGDDADLARLLKQFDSGPPRLLRQSPCWFVLTKLRHPTEFRLFADPHEGKVYVRYQGREMSFGIGKMQAATHAFPHEKPGAALLMMYLANGLCERHKMLPHVTVAPDLCRELATTRNSHY